MAAETTKIDRLEEYRGGGFDLADINEGASQIEPEGDRYAPAQMDMIGREAPQTVSRQGFIFCFPSVVRVMDSHRQLRHKLTPGAQRAGERQ